MTDEYARGEVAGRIDARLKRHDDHFSAINGQLLSLTQSIQGLRLDVQRLGDQAQADAATVIATAAALKEAEEARRNQTENRWSPWTKVFAVVAVVATLVTLYYLVRSS